MDTLSARKADGRDYHLIKVKLLQAQARMLASGHKPHIALADNPDKCMQYIYNEAEAWIVNGYLVAYEIGSPWYTDRLILSELIICRLRGNSAFGVVPSFLEHKAREAGCTLITAGTALARSDRALASLYMKHGFTLGALSLTKEL